MQSESFWKQLTLILVWQLASAWMFCSEACGEPPITAIAFAPDGQELLLGSQAGIQVQAWPKLQASSKTIPTELANIHDLAFAPDGKELLVAGGSPAESGIVEVYSWPDAKLIRRVSKHDDLVYRVAWSPSGQEWASAGADGLCMVWSRATGETLASYAGHSRAVLALCYLPDGNTLASAGADQTIQLWNGQSGARLRTLDNHLAAVHDIAVRAVTPQAQSSNAASATLPTLVSAADDRTVRIWQPTIGRLVRFVRLPTIAQAVVWTPEGDKILAGCIDGRVLVIDPETAVIAKELKGIEQRIFSVALAPTGRSVIAAGDRQVLSIAW